MSYSIGWRSPRHQRGCSVTFLIEEALRVALQSATVPEQLPPLFSSRQAPGMVVDIELSDSSAACDYLDDADSLNALS